MSRDLSRLVRDTTDPLYVYSFERVAENLQRLRSQFKKKLQVHYALKTNSNLELLKRLSKLGVGVDVVSGGEIRRSLEGGFKGHDIVFSGVGKSVEDIELALKTKILAFNVESLQELERLGTLSQRLKTKATVHFRINPNVSPKTHPYITTGFRENKFGMDLSAVPDLLNLLSRFKRSLTLEGLHFHIGSQIMTVAPFEEALKKSIPLYKELKSQGYPLKAFDVGGGIGVPYKGEKPFPLKDYGRMIEKYLLPLKCQIACEPGRYLLADAGLLLTKVEYVKTTPYKTFVIVNTGMHHLLRPSLYQAYHKILPLRDPGKNSLTKVDVVGPICESSDWLAKDRALPKCHPGDWLAICDVGAYGFVMASRYNLQSEAREVFID